MNCTVLSISTVPLHADKGDSCMVDDGDVCEADEGKLATAPLRVPQLSPHFSEAFHTAKTFVFLAASLLTVKRCQPFPSKLVHPEVDGSDLCKADSS